MMRSAAKILVDQLVIQGIDTVFCVPGESFLAVLDALVDEPRIRLITCRHEGGAAMMAEAWGKLTGRPGIVFASRAPGTTNASAGLHIAAQDSTPMILFIGQNPRDVMEREAFQEVAQARGRPLLIALRVPESILVCTFDGIDIETWVREQLVDILITGCGASDVDVPAYRRLAEGTSVKIYPSWDVYHPTDGYRQPPVEYWRGLVPWGAGANLLKPALSTGVLWSEPKPPSLRL